MEAKAKLLRCKLLMFKFDKELFFINKSQVITEIRKLQKDCEKALQEELFLDFKPDGITCYDKNDLTIFRLEYLV